MTTVALTIAGSDPSGGAGIQADLRTFAALGVVGVSVITALTVQNTLGVQSVHPVPADVLAAQLEAVFSDIKIHAVKIGMLGGADQVRAVAAALRKYQPPNIVLDPVLASTGGVPLLDKRGQKALMEHLLPLCHFVTPNVPEAEILTGISILIQNDMHHAARQLAGARRAALVKGGHFKSSLQAIDVLIQPFKREIVFSEDWVATAHTHGTGCLLSSAITAYSALGMSPHESVKAAKAILTDALKLSVVVGQGRGYPDAATGIKDYQTKAGRTQGHRLSLLYGLYVLTDPDLRPDRSPIETTKAALAGGAKIIQLRDKSLPLRQLIALARDLNKKARERNALFIINDRVDVALASDADGVHLGPDDVWPKDARRLLGPDKLVGVSVATLEEAGAAAPYASYFGVGAIFGSTTKLDAGAPIGVGRIREIKAAFPHIPIVAIGGINAENIAAVAAAGADAAAVVSAVVAAPDMEAATRELVRRFNRT